MSAGRQKFLKYVESHGKSHLVRAFHPARLHLHGIAIQLSGPYTRAISAWIVENTNYGGKFRNAEWRLPGLSPVAVLVAVVLDKVVALQAFMALVFAAVWQEFVC